MMVRDILSGSLNRGSGKRVLVFARKAGDDSVDVAHGVRHFFEENSRMADDSTATARQQARKRDDDSALGQSRDRSVSG